MHDIIRINAIHKALQAIASHCDGAHTHDEMGFNSVDANFGKSLAAKFTLSPKQAVAAWKMLHKYRRQLELAGIEYDDLEPPEIKETVAPTVTGVAYLRGPWIFYEFPYDPGLVEKIKQIPGRKFVPSKKNWKAPASAENLDLTLRLEMSGDLELYEDVHEAIEEAKQRIKTLEGLSSATDADKIDIPQTSKPLRPFQRAGVQYAVAAKRCFIADEMGLGKTVQALMAVEHEQAYPCVVVCPSVVKLNWEHEIEMWLPQRSTNVLFGRGGSFVEERADFVILNYEILDAWIDQLEDDLDPESIIIDESHYTKSRKAKRTKLCKRLAKSREYVFCLTGTPVVNRPEELIGQLQVLNRMHEFGDPYSFEDRYCAARNVEFTKKNGQHVRYRDTTGASNLRELNDRLRQTCYIRRLKKDVLKDLPAKQRAVVPITLSNYHIYKEAEEDLVRFLGEQAISDEQWLASIEDLPYEHQLSQIEERRGEKEESALRAEAFARIATLKKLTAEGKLDAATDWIEDFLESGEKLVVFGWHVAQVEELARRFKAPFITGGTSSPAREDAIQRFQTDSRCNLLVANIKAGGVGITLTAASNVAFFELGWSPSDMDQAEDRCHRIGQQNSVTAWYLLGDKTIDHEIYKLINEKRIVVNEASDGGKVIRGSVAGGLLKTLKGGS